MLLSRCLRIARTCQRAASPAWPPTRSLTSIPSITEDKVFKAVNATLRTQDDVARSDKHSEALSRATEDWKKQYSLLQSLHDLAQHDQYVDMRELAEADLEDGLSLYTLMRQSIQDILIPADEHDEYGALLEVKAGVGGTEAAVFCADLVRMYTKLAARKSWKTSVMDSAPVLGSDEAYRSAFLEFSGASAFGHLRHEIGVHRVQRVPANDTAGRVHTSTTAVIVSPNS